MFFIQISRCRRSGVFGTAHDGLAPLDISVGGHERCRRQLYRPKEGGRREEANCRKTRSRVHRRWPISHRTGFWSFRSLLRAGVFSPQDYRLRPSGMKAGLGVGATAISKLGRNVPRQRPVWDQEECVMLLQPPRSQYVDNSRCRLHLWRPIRQVISMPPAASRASSGSGRLKRQLCLGR